jgi:hypothetical protein
MKGWMEDYTWTKPLLKYVKQILGLVFFGEPPIEEDQERNTDLMVLKLKGTSKVSDFRIAVRIRKFKYYSKYKNEFTIRSSRPSGVKTELEKILDGWGAYYFYGFANELETGIYCYTLADLRWISCWIKDYQVWHDGRYPGTEMPNEDGSSLFRCIRWSDIPKPDGTGFILKRWDPDSTTLKERI